MGRRESDRREGRGTGDRRRRAFGRILMLSAAFGTERGRQEGGEGDSVTGERGHLSAFACFRAHLGRRDGEQERRKADRVTGGGCILAYFRAFKRIWDGERGTGGKRRGQGDRRGGHLGAFGTERGGAVGKRGRQCDRRVIAFGRIFMLPGAFATKRAGQAGRAGDRGEGRGAFARIFMHAGALAPSQLSATQPWREQNC